MLVLLELSQEWAPLHHAACAGQNSTVDFLLRSRADVNARNTNEEVALHLAFGNGHMEIIRLLMQVAGTSSQRVALASRSKTAHGHDPPAPLLRPAPTAPSVWRFASRVHAYMY